MGLKENADLLAFPIKGIIISFFRECHVPQPWKNADIIPIKKNNLITDINDHLRPTSLTPILSKVAEEFVVEQHLNPAIVAKIDVNQFATIPNSSTTHALISMLHSWDRSTDANGSTNRIILFDFRKGFDLIDHSILLRNLAKYDIPKTTLLWILDFITDRRQTVKLGDDCCSEWNTVPDGVRQRTKLGPWLFLVMMNELDLLGDVNLWKYVDDSTLSESEVIAKHSGRH